MKVPRIRLYLFPPRKGYYYSFMFEGKRYRGATEETDKSRAMAFAEVKRAEVITAGEDSVVPAAVTFEHFFTRKAGDGLEELTAANYRQYVERFIAYFGDNTPLIAIHSELRKKDDKLSVEGWKNWLLTQPLKRRKGTLSRKTVVEHLAWLSAVYRHCKFTMNPVKGVKRPKKTDTERQEHLKFYTPEEIRKLLDKAKGLAFGTDPDAKKAQTDYRQFYLWLIFLVYSGARLGEMRKIRVKDLEMSTKSVWLTSDKTKKRRQINVSQVGEPIAAITKMKDGQFPENPFLALSLLKNETKKQIEAAGGKVTPDTFLYTRKPMWFYKTLSRVCKKAGVTFKDVHALRHSFATKALKTWQIGYLSKWLGHANIQTTLGTYAHLLNEPSPAFKY